MSSNTLSRLVLIASVCAVAGVGKAQTAYSNYSEAIAAARVQFNGGDYRGAQKITEEALALAQTPSEKAAALTRVGMTYSKRKLYPQAIEQWTKALQLPGISSEDALALHSLLATDYSAVGQWEKARAEWTQVVRNPEALPGGRDLARLALAATYANQHQESQARQAYLAIAQDAAINTEVRGAAYQGMAESFSRGRQFDQAQNALANGLGLPNLSTQSTLALRADLGKSYQAQGNAARAQQEFNKAQALALVQYKLYNDAGQFGAARETLELFLTLGKIPSILEANVGVQIGYLLQKEDKPAQAIEAFERMLSKTYQVSAGQIVLVSDMRQTAQFAIAKTYAQQGNKAQAQQVLKTLLALDNLNAGVQTAAQKLLDSLDAAPQ